jgi:putative membrane protein
MSIRNYTDHAANERTFLAWVRTGIAVIAFGFLVERFDLFLSYLARVAPHGRGAVPATSLANIAGLTLIVLGMIMIAIAAVRFRRTSREIDAPDVMPGVSDRFDVALALLLVLLSGGLLFYLAQTLAANG